MKLRLKQSWSQGFVKANPAVANPGSVAGLEVLHITSSYWCRRRSNIYHCPAGCGLKPQSGTSCVSSSGQGRFNLSLRIRCRNSSIAYHMLVFCRPFPQSNPTFDCLNVGRRNFQLTCGFRLWFSGDVRQSYWFEECGTGRPRIGSGVLSRTNPKLIL